MSALQSFPCIPTLPSLKLRAFIRYVYIYVYIQWYFIYVLMKFV